MQLNDADTIVAVLLAEDIARIALPDMCLAPNCERRAEWATDDLTDYCDEHSREWLMAESAAIGVGQ